MSILVCGGAGYIGSHVCKALSKRGFEVIVYDNLSHGYKDFARWGEFISGDINDADKLDHAFKKFTVKAVMHFCAFIEVGESVIDPQKYYINNVKNTLTLLEAMKRNNIDKFIFSSTAAVYGMPEKIPIEEDDKKIQINPYGKSKFMIEQMLEDYSTAYGMKNIRFRYFNAAGADPDTEIGEAHKPESHLVPLILDAAIGKRDNIKIFGTDYDTLDGSCVRDYIHVNDLSDAHILGLQYLLDGGHTDYFNLGSGEGYSVREVIDMVKKVTGRYFNVIETDKRPGDPPFLIAKSDKAKKILEWKRQFGLKEIVRDAWAWHQKMQNLSLK